jgi:hypothetical protein
MTYKARGRSIIEVVVVSVHVLPLRCRRGLCLEVEGWLVGCECKA